MADAASPLINNSTTRADGPRFEIQSLNLIGDSLQHFQAKLRRNGKHLVIEIKPENFHNSPIALTRWAAFIERAIIHDEDFFQLYDADTKFFFTQPARQFMTEFAPEPSVFQRRMNLRKWMLPDWAVANVYFNDEKITIDVKTKANSPRRPYKAIDVCYDPEGERRMRPWKAWVEAHNLILTPEDPKDVYFRPPRKVTVRDSNRTYYFRNIQPYCPHVIANELTVYRKIEDRRLYERANLDRVLGFVLMGNGVIGYLTNDRGGSGERKLDQVWERSQELFGSTKPSRDDRKRWVAQITTAVRILHANSASWGNAHPKNVQIDDKGDAWVTNFNHNDMSLGETLDFEERNEDIDGLYRIKRFLRLHITEAEEDDWEDSEEEWEEDSEEDSEDESKEDVKEESKDDE